MNRLAGKIAFITGVSSGQGQAAARLFAAEGAIIVGCYRSRTEGARTTEAMVRDVGGRMVTTQCDLMDGEAARAWIRDAVAEVGGIDILYNNAASARSAPFDELSYDDWNYTLRGELDILFHTCQAAWPHLIERGGGAIINTASTAGLRGRMHLGAAGHVTGKAGVMGFTRQLAAEGAQHSIRVNTISPGIIATENLRKSIGAEMDRVIANVPLARIGQPEDIAYCALWLASDEAAWVTAQNLVIDGGTSEIK